MGKRCSKNQRNPELSEQPPSPKVARTRAPPPPKRFQAIYDFSSEGEDEISFQQGDILLVRADQDDNGWAMATHEATGQQGIVHT